MFRSVMGHVTYMIEKGARTEVIYAGAIARNMRMSEVEFLSSCTSLPLTCTFTSTSPTLQLLSIASHSGDLRALRYAVRGGSPSGDAEAHCFLHPTTY